MSCEEQLARYKVLIDTARCFSRAMNLPALIDEILNRSQEVMGAEVCSLFLPDPATGELVLHSTDPRLASLPQPLRVPPGQGIAGAVFQTREAVNIRDVQSDHRHYQPIGKQTGFVARTMLAIPLRDGPDCLGVMEAINPRRRDRFDDKDEEIFEGFGGLIANALLRLEAEHREIELVRSKQEMELAREIQESFLPPARQKFPSCQVHIRYIPAYSVGGDFCCVQRIGEERLLLGVADVTGKGVPAALTTARATAMIKGMAAQMRDDLGEWVTEVNQQFVQDLRAGRFIGMTFMLADAATSTLQICAAGQFPPLRSNWQPWASFPLLNHLPLGISTAARYRAVTTTLEPGDFWLLYTDGIPEARNLASEDYTSLRFQESLPVGQTAARTLETSVSAWRRFVGSAPRHDDASLLLLDWRGQPPPSSFQCLCGPNTFCLGREFVEKWATFAGYDDVTTGQIVLACDEAATNIFRHAYAGMPGPLRCQASMDEVNLTFQISDDARSVDVAKIRGRDLSELRPGGLGTFIMTQVFDEVEYAPSAHGTSLTLRKRLP